MKKHETAPEEDEDDLTPAEYKSLFRQIADHRDPRRYMIFCQMLTGFYSVSDDTWAFDNPEGGTLFKRQKKADLIRKSLRRKGKGLKIIEVKLIKGKIVGAPRFRRRRRRS